MLCNNTSWESRMKFVIMDWKRLKAVKNSGLVMVEVGGLTCREQEAENALDVIPFVQETLAMNKQRI
jgi:hypothetical protein